MTTTPATPDTAAVRTYLLGLQDRICTAIEAEDGTGRFREETWDRPEGGGRSRVLTEGAVSEQAGRGSSSGCGWRDKGDLKSVCRVS